MPDKYPPIPCADCGKAFSPKHWYQKFCGGLCRLRANRRKKREAAHLNPQRTEEKP